MTTSGNTAPPGPATSPSAVTKLSSSEVVKSAPAQLPDTHDIKLKSNGLPFHNQEEALAFYATLDPNLLSHVAEDTQPIWQATVSPTTNMVSPNYYYFGKSSQAEFMRQYPQELPKVSKDVIALDETHVVTQGGILSSRYPTLKRGTPGVIVWLTGNDMRDKDKRTVFIALDGSVYVTFDKLRAAQFEPGIGPLGSWPEEVQNPFVPNAFSGFSSEKHKIAHDKSHDAYDACEHRVAGQFQPEFRANDAANITSSTRANREKQIGERQEKAILSTCGKLAAAASQASLLARKGAALEQLAFRVKLYKLNRERFGK